MYVYVPLVCDVLLKDGMFCADLNASFVQIQIPSGLAHVWSAHQFQAPNLDP
jgi:hypothetical protein